jgi:ATP-dependent DNA ligase
LDGEIVAYDFVERKVREFASLQKQARKHGNTNPDLIGNKIFLFDCIMDSGKSLLGANLEKRKLALGRILGEYKTSEAQEIDRYTS